MDESGQGGRGNDREMSFSDAVEAIYRATAAPGLWPQALDAIADCFGDVGANLLYQPDEWNVALISSPRIERSRREYETGWWKRDIRIVRAVEREYLSRRDAWSDQDLVSEAEIESHPYYAEFLASHGLRWSASINLSPDPHAVAGLAVQRASDRPPYSESELALLTRLARHVENALRLGIRLMRAEAAQFALGEALARLDAGVFLVDSLGRATAANSSADRLLANELMLVDGRLSPRVGDRALARAIEEVVGREETRELPDPYPVVLHGVGEDGFHVAYVLPVPSHEKDPFAPLLADVGALVLVLRSHPGEPPDPTLVRDLLDLTLAEARVASLVGMGLPPREAAGRLGITEQTTRTTLKRIFWKTGVSRQSELAALLTRLTVQ